MFSGLGEGGREVRTTRGKAKHVKARYWMVWSLRLRILDFTGTGETL